jgi:hypothetical protein
MAPKKLIQIGRIAIIIGVTNAILVATKSIPGDPLLIGLVVFIGVISIVTGNCLKSLGDRMRKVEEHIWPRSP